MLVIRRMALAAGVLQAFVAGGAHAISFDLWGAEFAFDNQFVVGGTWRMEARDDSLVGKLNVNPDLCPDDCVSFNEDPGPNQRLVDAPGAFLGANTDDGNLNYDRHDIVAAQARLQSEMEVFIDDTAIKVSGLGFYDNENTDFREYHPDTAFQPRRTDRPGNLEDRIGNGVDLLEAHITQPFDLFGRRWQLRVGEQRLRWGESTFVAQNSLDQINPPDQNRLHFPGSEIASVFEPTGLAVLSTNLTGNLAMELVYQYHWEPVAPAAASGFFSTNDIAGGGDNLVLSLGQFSEDPQQVGGFKNPLAQLITDTATNVPVSHHTYKPEDGGQYGINFDWYAPDINGGTEFGFYYLHYHSRLPYLGVTATERSCTRDGAGDLVTTTVACEGFNGDLNVLQGLPQPLQDALGLVTDLDGDGELGREPLPIDTMGAYLEYPEDIDLYGISFNTNVGKWSLAGEFAYRPNLPVQVSFPDVIFAGLQPALPAEDIDLLVATIPGARNAVPDFIETRYRGNTVQAGDRIAGYERMRVGQVDFTGIRIFGSSNPIGADQILLLTEVGATYMFNRPGLDELQFEGGGPNCTHFSPGADGTGLAEGETNNARSLNPTKGEGCYADEFSWGYRILATMQYNNLLFGFDYEPVLAFFHDVDGVAPFPMQNFVEERKEFIVGSDVIFTPALKGGIQYRGYFGSGERRNSLRDRDHLSLYLRYDF